MGGSIKIGMMSSSSEGDKKLDMLSLFPKGTGKSTWRWPETALRMSLSLLAKMEEDMICHS